MLLCRYTLLGNDEYAPFFLFSLFLSTVCAMDGRCEATAAPGLMAKTLNTAGLGTGPLLLLLLLLLLPLGSCTAPPRPSLSLDTQNDGFPFSSPFQSLREFSRYNQVSDQLINKCFVGFTREKKNICHERKLHKILQRYEIINDNGLFFFLSF